jgi:hypothetical protein
LHFFQGASGNYGENTMFDIINVGPPPGMPRLIALAKLEPADFAKAAAALGVQPIHATKCGFVAARFAKRRERIETRWNGKETEAIAEPGDAIATNMSPAREVLRDSGGNANVYVIRREKFPQIYEPDGTKCKQGDIYRSRASINAVFFPGGFELMAPWGEIQRANSGYLIQNGDELYGNNKDTFDATYHIQEP